MFAQQGMIRRPLEQAEEVAGHTNSQKRKLFEINNFNGNMNWRCCSGFSPAPRLCSAADEIIQYRRHLVRRRARRARR
jgi:hypothetical protein